MIRPALAVPDISIHAPSRERLLSRTTKIALAIFQSTLPRGSDSNLVAISVYSVLFQSTLPRGSDDSIHNYLSLMDISIHAPSRERLTVWGNYNTDTQISIHAPSRERQDVGRLRLIQQKFQSTLPRGSDAIIVIVVIIIFYFNPRSLAGAT